MIHRQVQLRRDPGKLREGQVQLLKQTLEVGARAVIQGQDADFAAHLAHIGENLVGGGLPKAEAVTGTGVGPNQPGEGQDGEIEVLAGDGKAQLPLGPGTEALLQKLGLGENLPGVAQELLPLPGDDDAPVGAGEDGDAQLLLQVADGGGEAGLGDEELFGGGADGAALGDSDGVFELLEGHGGRSFSNYCI